MLWAKITDAEINRVLNWAEKAIATGRNDGGSYEEGVKATLDWVLGYDEEAPDEE